MRDTHEVAAARFNGRSALAWACYLGSSWTWVIGMILPALLLRDFGLWGWTVFAVPNVLGAAAMGIVVGSPAASQRLVAQHRTACCWFSNVTIGYHLFVTVWLLEEMFQWPAVAVVAIVASLVLAAARSSDGLARTAAIVVTGLSLVCFAWAARQPEAWQGLDITMNRTRLTPWDLVLFAPAALCGFALCPYLDLTFHRARQRTSGATGRFAFLFGFGGVFLAMILFSLAYADLLGGRLGVAPDRASPSPLPMVWWVVLGFHLCLQTGFTVGVHLAEQARAAPSGSRRAATLFWLGAIALAVAIRVAGVDFIHDLLLGEVAYRGFLIAYGLVFPAYVLVCLVPTRRTVAQRRKHLTFWLAVLASLPLAWLGFVAARGMFIIAALAVLLVARIVVDRSAIKMP